MRAQGMLHFCIPSYQQTFKECEKISVPERSGHNRHSNLVTFDPSDSAALKTDTILNRTSAVSQIVTRFSSPTYSVYTVDILAKITVLTAVLSQIWSGLTLDCASGLIIFFFPLT